MRRRATVLATVLGAACRPAAVAPPPADARPQPALCPSDRLAVLAEPVNVVRWLERDAARARGLGAGGLQVVAGDVGSDGDRVGAFVAIPPDQCLLAYARGSPGVDDLDLFAWADDGSMLAVDEAADPNPAILLCPPHPPRAYVVARLAAGRGFVAVGAHVVPPSAAALVARGMGARGGPDEQPAAAAGWPGLDERVAARRRELGPGWEETRRTAVLADMRAPTRVSAPLDADRCLDVLAVPSDEVANLEVSILDEDGRVVGRAAASGRDRTAVVCSPVKTTVSVEVRPHAGRGPVAIVLARTEPGAARDAGTVIEPFRNAPIAPLATVRASRAKGLRAAGYPDATVAATGDAEIGRRASFKTDLQPGCSRLDVVGGQPAAGLGADLWDAAGVLATRAEGGEAAVLFACGKGGPVRVDVEALVRPGPFAIEVRKDAASPAPLVSNPVAAARLLGRLNAEGDVVTAAAAADAKVVQADAGALRSVDLPTGQSGCLHVVAAVDAGGSGIDLRILDARTLDERAAARGRFVASTRLCGPSLAGAPRAELRLGSGKANALVVFRPVPPPPATP